MHARLVIFKLGPGQRSTIQALAREFDPLYRAQPGFKELYVIADDLSGQYGSFSVWESQEDADAANAVIAPRLQRALAGCLEEPPDRWLFEVVEPTESTSPRTIEQLTGRIAARLRRMEQRADTSPTPGVPVSVNTSRPTREPAGAPLLL
jgi:hypothetical protein